MTVARPELHLAIPDEFVETVAQRAVQILLERTRTEDSAPRLLTMSAAAAALGLTEHAVRHHVRRRHIRSVRIGSRVLVPVEALGELEDEGPVATEPRHDCGPLRTDSHGSG